MSGSNQVDARIRAWVARGPDDAPTELVEAVLAEVPVIRQRHRWETWDRPDSWPRARSAAVAALLVALLAALLWAAGAFISGTRPASATWTPIGDVAAFGGGSISDVIEWGGELVAAGTVSEAGHLVGAFWASRDGRDWQRLPVGSAAVDLTMGRLAARNGTLTALAYECPPGPGYCGSTTILVTNDGRSWRNLSASLAACCGGNPPQYLSVLAGGPGFVAVGSFLDTSGSVIGASVATSIDGVSWIVQRSDTAVFAGTTMAGAAVGSGGLVAVGAPEATGLVAWHSTDGLTWSRGTVPAAADATFADVASDGGRYVAVGKLGARAASWASSDGVTWSLGPGSPALDSARMTRVAWDGRAFLALGASTAGNGLAWTSRDGISWTRIDTGEIFDGVSLVASALSGSELELFGTSGSGSGGPVIAVGAP